MNTSALQYKFSGIQRLSSFKETFNPDTCAVDDMNLDNFVNLFCEYQLADNNYMNIHHEASLHSKDDKWFSSLNLDEVLRLITYIIWTDKFLDGFLKAKVKDKSLYFLLTRLQDVQHQLVLPATSN
jgi:hypothetical protein